MGKRSFGSGGLVFTGIDVSAATLAVAVQQDGVEGCVEREFGNTAAGHKKLIAWLRKRGGPVRVSLEATGIYSLDVALALDAADGIEVAVLNPKRVHQFAQTLRRSKTDKADAVALCEYTRRMEFVAWQRPERAAMALRALSRHMLTLTEEHARLGNRLHAAEGSATTPGCVRGDLRRSRAGLEKRMARLRREAFRLIARNDVLKGRFELLMSVKGIGEMSAVQLLGELATLPPDMTVRQWVASSGLDPRHEVSGTSVHKRSRISRHGNRYLRRALFMPALVGVRFDQHMKTFYQQLQLRHKTKLQALTAVARKMLHAIYGIFKTNTAYDGQKLFPHLIPNS